MVFLVAGAIVAMLGGSASAELLVFDDGQGLSATADFSLVNSTTLKIVLTNTSSEPNITPGEPANSLLTSIAFDLPGDTEITGGTAELTAGSQSIEFDKIVQQLAGGDDVSVEWGYGNTGGTGFGGLVNVVSALTAHASPFIVPDKKPGGEHPNLDGPRELDGPQCGLAVAGWVPGGLGGIENSVTIFAKLSNPLNDVSFILEGAKVQYGSNFGLLPNGPGVPESQGDSPEPATCVLVGLAGLAVLRHLRKHKRLSRPHTKGKPL